MRKKEGQRSNGNLEGRKERTCIISKQKKHSAIFRLREFQGVLFDQLLYIPPQISSSAEMVGVVFRTD